MKRILLAILALTGSQGLFAQQAVTGTVTDEKGAPLEQATVVVLGTNIYTVTDASGQFLLVHRNQPPFTIRISSVGFTAQEIQITNLASPVLIRLPDDNLLTEVVVTARRRDETAQSVPIPISVVGAELLDDLGAFNISRVKELVPSVQMYSSNPRNTTLNIRGLGSTFGLTNDGIDPGVGFYVDGVYYARPAAAVLDFIDVEQIEVLRGPQGTLFGKNTTAGAFNIKTKTPSFTPGANFELSYGNFGYIQARTSLTGGIGDRFAGRLSFTGTQRDGVIFNERTNKYINDLNNLGVRGQLLLQASDNVAITLTGDASSQRPDGYAQIVAGVVPTQRAAYRQFEQIIADLNYDLPTRNPFDRVVDHDTPWNSGNQLGGLSLNVDAKVGLGTFTATTSWRYWNWDPSNDRDFTGLPVLQKSQATSKHRNWTQELRYAGDISTQVSGVVGVFFIGQDLKSDPYHIEESGAAQWRFSQSTTSSSWATPGLLDGYGIRTNSHLQTFGAAAFANVDWAITKRLHVLPGLRYNLDSKEVDYDRETYGGLDTTDPALIAIKRSVYSDQAFTTNARESNLSGQMTVAYKFNPSINTFATYSASYKPVGVNLGGLPTQGGEVMIDLATIKPEYVTHYEVGIKTSPARRSTLNLLVHSTDVDDFQTQVQSPEVGVNRGYLANAEKVRVYGAELDGNARISRNFLFFGAAAYTVGEYVSFTNAPVPLEETGAPSAFKDISGTTLPGISKWAASLGGELTSNKGNLLEQEGKFFIGAEAYYRSSFSSSPSPSAYLNIDGYALVNARIGFRAMNGLSVIIWSRNLLNHNYFEQLLPAAGNAGHYAAVLGDPGTYGVTLRFMY
jgi:iron complex outermembrane receptor protein